MWLHVGSAHVVVEADDAYVIGRAITTLDKGLHGPNSYIVKDSDVVLGEGFARINNVEHAGVCLIWSDGELVDGAALFRAR